MSAREDYHYTSILRLRDHYHHTVILNLDDGVDETEIVKYLKRLLDHTFQNPENCGICGGLTPELHFKRGNMRYAFCLYEVRKNNEVTAKASAEKARKV